MPEWFERLHGDCKDFFWDRMIGMQITVLRAHEDGIANTTPLLLATGYDVSQARTQFGRAMWRKIHHASDTTNLLRALVWYRFRQTAKWTDIIALPEHHLRSCRNAHDWETAHYAAHNAAPGKFLQTAMLYRDAVNLKITPQPGWTIARLRRERDMSATEAKISAAPTESWAQTLKMVVDGHLFTRLTTDKEILVEGIAMRHCVASYCDVARDGTVVVMRCEGAERATLLFGSNVTLELKGFANSITSERCAAAAQSMKSIFLTS